MKKLLSAILVIVMVAASLSFTVSAEDEFVITDGVLEKYNGTAAEVVIPDGVVSLGDLAFDGNPTVEKIYVPDTVETIGYSSFRNCANLRELHLGSSVSKIGD
ncbi:MAG: leucine-rich repeat protein, partial [Clostridia bacterium]|nr:leucine-rich repeat protein [Clostridia bacterium]